MTLAAGGDGACHKIFSCREWLAKQNIKALVILERMSGRELKDLLLSCLIFNTESDSLLMFKSLKGILKNKSNLFLSDF